MHKLPLLSEVRKDGIISDENAKSHSAHVQGLFDRFAISAEERDYIFDFLRVMTETNRKYNALYQRSKTGETRTEEARPEERKEEGTSKNADLQEAMMNKIRAAEEQSQQLQQQLAELSAARREIYPALEARAERPIKMNELVTRPEIFDGQRPMPRKWIDKYKNAIKTNDWTDRQAVRYFPGFLTREAEDWFITEVCPNLSSDTTFSELEQLFAKNFMGPGDYEYLCQQVEKTRQGSTEPVSTFIPRLRRLLLLMEADMPQAQQVRIIKSKLRPQFKPLLALFHPQTVEELRDSCVDIEAGLPNSADIHSNSSQRQQSRRPSDRAQRINPGLKSTASLKKCYRCERLGHIAPACTATTKADGGRLNAKPDAPAQRHSTPSNNSAHVKSQQRVRNVNCEEVSLGNEEAEVETRVTTNMVNSVRRGPSAHSRPSAWTVNHVGPRNKLIKQNININGVDTPAIVDTGSFITIIDAQIAKENGWRIEGPLPSLVGADGNGLKALGTTRARLEVSIGKVTKSTVHRIAVVKNLNAPALFGLELLDALEISIHARPRRLEFPTLAKTTGVRAKTAVNIPARSQAIVRGSVNAVGPILIIPANLDQKVHVGNSIAEAKNNETPVLVLNNSTHDVQLNKGDRLALFEPIEETNKASSGLVGSVLEIADTEETVNIGDDLNERQIADLSNLFRKHHEAFSKNGELGCTNLAEHNIELLEGATPFVEPMRRRAHAQIEETRKQVADMLNKGIIEESSSPWASAYVLAKKKNGEYRLCVDFRKLNEVTKKVVFPLPNVDDCLDTLCGKHFFSQMDFSSGFWQLPMAEKSKELTAFRTEDNQYQFTRMPFGLCNAPASFQRMINAMISGLKGIHLQAFVDDVCVATDTWEEHLEILEKLLELVIGANLKLKGSKCTFGASRVTFLGHEISAEGIRQEQSKLRAITALRPPTDAKGVRRVLGLLSYYRKFVPNFAIIAEPLTKLTKKNSQFSWNDTQQAAFDKLISALAKNATLSHFNHKAPTMVKTDASHAGVAGMLLQRHENDWKIVACCSRRLSASEANYGITDLEGLAIIYTVTKFRHYLLGKHFEILTDHCALCVLNKRSPTSPRLKRWAIVMSEFDFKITYTKGNLHEDIDCLSRSPTDGATDEFLEERVYHVAAPTNMARWKAAYSDQESQEVIQKALAKTDGLKLTNDLVYKNGQLYVPHALRDGIIFENHDLPAAGHGGIQATQARMHLFWWPNMKESIQKYIEKCDTCIARKAERTQPAGTMHSFEIYEPFQCVAIDCMGPIAATVRDNKHIILAIDMFTRFVEAQAVPDVTGSRFSEFLSNFCGRYGIPKEILTDNASTFCNTMVSEVSRVYGIKHLKSTPQHSRGNAVAERAIQSLQEKLGLITGGEQTNPEWDVTLPVAVLALNTTPHRSTGHSPFELTFGRRPPINSEHVKRTTTVHDWYAQAIQGKLDELKQDAISNQDHSQAASKAYFAARHTEKEYEIGSLVMTKAQGRRAKLANRYIGPFEIISREKDIYKMRSFETGQLLTRHVGHLKAYTGNKDPTLGNPIGNKQPSAAMSVFLIIILTSMTQPLTGASTILKRAEPIVYSKTYYVAATQAENFATEVHISNPCSYIRNITGLSETTVRNAQTACHLRFHETITSNLESFDAWKKLRGEGEHAPRQRRFIFGFMVGVVVTDLIESYLSRVWRDDGATELDQELIKTQKAVVQLQKRSNITGLIQRATRETIEKIGKEVALNKKRIEDIEWSDHQLTLLYSWLTEKFQTKALYLHKLRYAFKHNRLDLEALSGLTETDWPEELEESTVKLIDIKVVTNHGSDTSTLRVEFNGRCLLPKTHVIKVEGITHLTNFTHQIAEVAYTGPSYAIFNTATNCIKGIDHPSKEYVEDACQEKDSFDPRLASWSTTKTLANLKEYAGTTRVVETGLNSFIYCFTLNIEINGQSQMCPHHVFTLSAGRNWTTPGFKHIGNITAVSFNETWELPPIHVGHSSATGLDETKLILHIDELNQEFEHTSNPLLVVKAPLRIGYASYALSGMATALIIFLTFKCIIYPLYQMLKPNSGPQRIELIQHGPTAPIAHKRPPVSPEDF